VCIVPSSATWTFVPSLLQVFDEVEVWTLLQVFDEVEVESISVSQFLSFSVSKSNNKKFFIFQAQKEMISKKQKIKKQKNKKKQFREKIKKIKHQQDQAQDHR
jgi:hypothetical protein